MASRCIVVLCCLVKTIIILHIPLVGDWLVSFTHLLLIKIFLIIQSGVYFTGLSLYSEAFKCNSLDEMSVVSVYHTIGCNVHLFWASCADKRDPNLVNFKMSTTQVLEPRLTKLLQHTTCIPKNVTHVQQPS